VGAKAPHLLRTRLKRVGETLLEEGGASPAPTRKEYEEEDVNRATRKRT